MITQRNPKSGNEAGKTNTNKNDYAMVDQVADEDLITYRFWYLPSSETPELNYHEEPSFSSRIKKVVKSRRMVCAFEKGDCDWYRTFYDKHSEAWISLNLENGTQQLHPVEKFTQYQQWQGDNIFFWKGRIMFGNDISIFIGVNFLIAGVLMWEIFYSLSQYPPATMRHLVTTSLIIAFWAIYNLWGVAITEPGIVPRNHPLLELKSPGNEGLNERVPKYCETCNLYQPRFAQHCYCCNNCVEGYDHHCGVIGTCIGKRNYHFFARFLFYTGILSAFLAVCNLYLLWTTFQSTDASQNIIHRCLKVFAQERCVFLVMVFCGQMALMLIGLSCHFTGQFVYFNWRYIHRRGKIVKALLDILKLLAWLPKLPTSQLPAMAQTIQNNPL